MRWNDLRMAEEWFNNGRRAAEKWLREESDAAGCIFSRTTL